jgi:hypothetical protein
MVRLGAWWSYCSRIRISASSRISKGQGYQGFLRKRAGSSFGQKKGNLRRTRENLKNGQNFTTFRVNKMFSHKF